MSMIINSLSDVDMWLYSATDYCIASIGDFW